MHKHIEIYNYFTKIDPNSQRNKADEEFNELVDSYIAYDLKPDTDEIQALYYEICDLRFLIEQIMIVEDGFTLEELKAMFESKVNRTYNIVKECKRTKKEYDEIRRKM